ncbi:MAG: sigma-70 family RNA polymerase sigma factor [Mangrovibacterium sp.]
MESQEFYTSLIGLQKNLYYFAISLTNSEEKAQDLTQETMLKALSYKDKFREETNLKAWLCTIMKNTFINQYRKNSRHMNVLEGATNEFEKQIAETRSFPSPDAFYSSEEINKKIDALEDEFRIPFTMFVDGFKYKEIADELDLPLGTVKSRIFLTRKKLSEQLPEYHSEYIRSGSTLAYAE